ncbi:hypothetical protein ACIBJE_17355 [Micromonospora sp. NPDC050187]|uniref:hypothetical protein n=1 Tax=Micromonospora sp. NPDC050187 TaxID=3364277 RepID=UPI0037B8C46D
MSGLELIAAALAAGASAGVSGAATQAVQDSYAELKALLRRALQGRGNVAAEIETLDAEQATSGVWRTRLGGPVAESGAADDQDVLAAARELLDAAEQARLGRYRVEIHDSQGLQVGDHNQQSNHFG